MRESDEALEVLVTADELGRARGRELHAGLAKCVAGSEVVLRVHLDGEHALTSLDAGSRSNVLSERAAHSLRHTVSTGTGGLLVFPEDMVRERVDAESVTLCTGLLTDGGIGNHTGGLKGCVADLHIVVSTQFEHDGELPHLCSTAVTDVVLVNSVVGNTADVLTASVGRSLQAAVHDGWFTCHRYASKQACDRCSLYDISAEGARAAEVAHPQQRLHGLKAPPQRMAEGWRRYLEEESEHQWLAISGFFIFILLGGFALEATSDFVGDDMVRVENQHEGALVLDIVYHGEPGTYTALVYAPDAGYHMFTEFADGTVNEIYSPDAVDLGREVNFLTTIDDRVVFSSTPNAWIELHNNAMLTYQIQTNGEDFDVLNVVEHPDQGHTLLLTQEGQFTTVRGVVNLQSTPPMSTTSGVQWNDVAHLEGDVWVAIGHHIATAGADGSSPATPERKPAIGFIAWDGTNQTPVLTSVNMMSGTFHSLVSTEDGAVVGGTETSYIIANDASIAALNAPSASTVADASGTVWFFGEQGATTIGEYSEGEYTVHTLSRPMPVEIHTIALQGTTLQLHGTDASGAPAQWSIDTTANGSIESGRGFLNLLFLIAGAAVLGLMTAHAGRSLIGSNRT